MKDKLGKDLNIGSIVIVNGLSGQWVVTKGQDDFGDVEVRHCWKGHELHRHPSSLCVINK